MARRCDVPGCDRPHHARGWCSHHHRRWARTGDPLGVHGDPIEWRQRRADPDPLVCKCPPPLELSPFGECSRCHRVHPSSFTPNAYRLAGLEPPAGCAAPTAPGVFPPGKSAGGGGSGADTAAVPSPPVADVSAPPVQPARRLALPRRETRPAITTRGRR